MTNIKNLFLLLKPEHSDAEKENFINLVDSKSFQYNAIENKLIEHKINNVFWYYISLYKNEINKLELKKLLNKKIGYFNEKYKRNKKAYKKIEGIFQDNNVYFIVLKGLSILKNVYNNSFMLRYFNDIDFLLSPDDVIKANDLLYAINFKATKFKISKEAAMPDLLSRLKSRSHLLDYSNDNGGYIELHQYKYNVIDLEKLYFEYKEKGQSYINDVDCLLIACDHVLHHYPFSLGAIKYNRKARIKDYLDVYQAYKVLRRRKKTNQIIRRAIELGNEDTVRNVLIITEKLYGEFVEDRRWLNSGQHFNHDWVFNGMKIPFWDRVINKDETYKRVINEYKLNKSIYDTKLFCYKRVNENRFRTTSKINIPSENNSILWDDKLDFSTIFFPEEIKIEYLLGWDLEALFLYNKFSSKQKLKYAISGEFDKYATKFELSFSLDEKGIPNVIYLQKQENGIVNIFSITESNEYKIIEENINTQIIKNDDAFDIAIPWEVIGFRPDNNFYFLMEIKLEKRTVKKNDWQIINYFKGKGADPYNCITHNTIMLL